MPKLDNRDKQKKRIQREKRERATLRRKTNQLGPPPKITRLQTLWLLVKKRYAEIVIIFTILGWILNSLRANETIIGLTTTTHEKYIKEQFIPGILLPRIITDTSSLIFSVGDISFVVNIPYLKKHNIALGQNFTCMDEEDPVNLGVIIQGNRILFSIKIRDLEKEEIVGEMIDNEWRLFKPNTMDWYNDDSTLEVTDKKGNIPFSIRLLGPNHIKLQGYFITDKTVMVINNTSFTCSSKKEPDYKAQMLESVRYIKSYDPKRNFKNTPIK